MSATPEDPRDNQPRRRPTGEPGGWQAPPPSGSPYSYGGSTPPGYGTPYGQDPAPQAYGPHTGQPPYGEGAAQQPYRQQPSEPPYVTAPAPAGGNFFQALFDLSFNRYITLSFAKIIYIIALTVIGLLYLVFVLAAFAQEPAVGVLTLLLGWIPALFYIVLVRVGLEFTVAAVKTAQNTSELVRRQH